MLVPVNERRSLISQKASKGHEAGLGQVLSISVPKPSVVAAAVAGVFALNAPVVYGEDACTQMGGTMQNGVCVVARTSMDSGQGMVANTDLWLKAPVTVTVDTEVRGVKEWTAQFSVADGIENSFTITNGADVRFMGSEVVEGGIGVYAVAVNGGHGTLNIESGTLSTSGVGEVYRQDYRYSHGLLYLAQGSDSEAVVNVRTGAKWNLKSGGVYKFAVEGATATINIDPGAEIYTDSMSGRAVSALADEQSQLNINNKGSVSIYPIDLGNVHIVNEGADAILNLGTLAGSGVAEKDNVVLENKGGATADIAYSGEIRVINEAQSTLTLRTSNEGSDVSGSTQYLASLDNSGTVVIETDVVNPRTSLSGKYSYIDNKASGNIEFNGMILYETLKSGTQVDINNNGKITLNDSLTRTQQSQPFEFSGQVNITNNENALLTFGDKFSYMAYGAGNIKIDNKGKVEFTENSIDGFAFVLGNNFEYVNIDYINQSTGTTSLYAKNMFEIKESGEVGPIPINLLSLNDGKWTESSITVDGFETDTSAAGWQLKADWTKYSTWKDGGTLIVQDVVEGSKAADQMQDAFGAAFGTGTNIVFLGKDDWASEDIVEPGVGGSAFNVDVVKKIVDAGYAGAIVTNFRLNNNAADGAAQPLTVGNGVGKVITSSFGFQGIDGASSVTVNNGQTLALIGLAAGSELVAGGAPVTLDNGTLKLGVAVAESARADSSTAGSLETITMKNGSKVETENMWVQAESITGEGSVSLTDTGRMHVKNLTISGDIRNQGTLSADTLTISKGSAASSKTLKSSGKITVESTASLSADGILAADSFDIKGVVKLGKNAAVYTGAAALEQMRKDHADAAAELDRVEGKAGVSTLSVLDRIVAESMKTSGEAEGTEQGKDGERATFIPDKESEAAVFTGGTSKPKVEPAAAQAFAAFDAVNRIAGEIESGAAPDRHGLWVKLEANDGRFGVVEGGSSFDVDTEGAVVGAEAAVADGVKLGAALSYLDGEIDASGLKNNWTSWGLHLYGAYRADAFALKGTAGWLRGTTEAEKDLDADVWHAGLRAEYGVPAGAMTVTPFMGARVMSGSFDGLESQTVFSIPLGAKLSGTIEAGGWTLTPALEAAYVRSMGDTEAEDVRFLPKDTLRGSIGLKAGKGLWTGELSYVGATGSNGYRSNTLNVKLGLMF